MNCLTPSHRPTTTPRALTFETVAFGIQNQPLETFRKPLLSLE